MATAGIVSLAAAESPLTLGASLVAKADALSSGDTAVESPSRTFGGSPAHEAASSRPIRWRRLITLEI